VRRFFVFIFPAFFLLFFVVSPAFADTATPSATMYIDIASTSALANGLYAITGELYIIGWILAIGVGWYLGNWLYRR